MSYDLEIWTAQQIELETILPEQEKWQRVPESWIFPGKKWQLVVSGFDRVLSEDVPEIVSRLLPGISFLVSVNLEGNHSVAAARKLLRQASLMIAKTAHGVIIDPQTDIAEMPSGIKRYVPPPRSQRFSILEMSWWFTKGPLLSNDGRDSMLSCMEKFLPEALPKRYGDYEPPQNHYVETGRQHFLEFLSSPRGVVVWYPHNPVVDVALSIAKSSGATRLGFRCHRLSIAIDVAALGQPGWQLGVKNFWIAMSKVIQPFFGDVRTLHGLVRGRGTVAYARDSEQHPVVSWWWKGIPKTCGHAAVLGEPYLGLWPEFIKHATLDQNLGFLFTDDWAEPDEVTSRIGGVPNALAQQPQPVEPALPTSPRPKGIYPQIWPFGEPYSDSPW